MDTVTHQCHCSWFSSTSALTKDIVVIKIRIRAELLFPVPRLEDEESQFDANRRETKWQRLPSRNRKWKHTETGSKVMDFQEKEKLNENWVIGWERFKGSPEGQLQENLKVFLVCCRHEKIKDKSFALSLLLIYNHGAAEKTHIMQHQGRGKVTTVALKTNINSIKVWTQDSTVSFWKKQRLTAQVSHFDSLLKDSRGITHRDAYTGIRQHLKLTGWSEEMVQVREWSLSSGFLSGSHVAKTQKLWFTVELSEFLHSLLMTSTDELRPNLIILLVYI